MENWTQQKTFDTVVAHLRKQNERAMNISDEGDSCRYLADDGKTCAAGCLIKPEDYKITFEGKAVVNIFDKPSDVGLLLESYGHDLYLLRALQNCHDNFSVEFWENRFQKIAEQFQLTYVPKTNQYCAL